MSDGWLDRLAAQLDRDKPRWGFEWATQQELLDFVNDHDRDKLRYRVAIRLFHPILHAGLATGIVLAPEKEKPE